jgi:Zn/Cd-binding protein ZinT
LSGKHKNFDGGKDRKEKTMEKKHGVFFGFAVLMIMAIFTFAGCDNSGGGNDEPELAKWEGTWNSVSAYFEDTDVMSVFDSGLAEIKAKWNDNNFSSLTVANLKTIMLIPLDTKTFNSLTVKDDTITFYQGLNTQGTVVSSANYTLLETTEDNDGISIYVFEGDKAGPYKYVRTYDPERESDDSALCFHIQYGPTLETFDNPQLALWWPAIAKQNSSKQAIKNTLSAVFSELANAEGEFLVFLKTTIKTILGWT